MLNTTNFSKFWVVGLVAMAGFVATAFPLTSTASADALILLDINFDGAGSNSLKPDSMGRHWNGTAGVAPTTVGNIASNVRDTFDNPTGITFALMDGFAASNTSGPTSSSLTDWDAGATSDSWYIGVNAPGNDDTAVMSIKNLDAANTYDLVFYGARNDALADRPMQVTIGATTQYYQSADEGLTTFLGLSPDINDEIIVQFVNNPVGQGYAYLNAVQLTVHTPVGVPEPATMSLLVAGMVAGLMRRR